jgi:hypothetical protein
MLHKLQFRIVSVAIIGALFATADLAGQVVQIYLTGGVFATNGGTPFSDGRLLQLVASTGDATFASPTATSFVGGNTDDVVIASFAVDSSVLNVAGSVSVVLNINLSSFPTVAQNNPLLLRWYNIDFGASSPGSGTNYSEYRSASGDESSDPWLMGGSGQSLSLGFVTASLGGSLADSAGFATSPIPEPAETATFAALGALALGFYRRRLRSSK